MCVYVWQFINIHMFVLMSMYHRENSAAQSIHSDQKCWCHLCQSSTHYILFWLHAPESHSRLTTSESHSRLTTSESHSRLTTSESHSRLTTSESHSRLTTSESHSRLTTSESHFWFLLCLTLRFGLTASLLRTDRLGVSRLTDWPSASDSLPVSQVFAGTVLCAVFVPKYTKKGLLNTPAPLPDARDKIPFLATHLRTNTETHTYTSIYTQMYIYIYIHMNAHYRATCVFGLVWLCLSTLMCYFMSNPVIYIYIYIYISNRIVCR